MSGFGEVGQVMVMTTSGRGWTPEECAERCVARMMMVAETAPPPIRDQAIAFRDAIYRLTVHHMREAIRSDRTTVVNKLREAGQHDAAALIERL